jgi:hypothetical protein
MQRDGYAHIHARVAALLQLIQGRKDIEQFTMAEMTPAKRKRLIQTYGRCPAGYTHDDLERYLDLLYGMYANLYSQAELRQIVLSDPFDRGEPPRRIHLLDLAAWLEALVSSSE